MVDEGQANEVFFFFFKWSELDKHIESLAKRCMD